METIVIALVAVLVVAAVALFGFRKVVQKLVVARAQGRLNDGAVEQWDRLLALLESKSVVEFFAPSGDFTKEWDADKKKPSPRAWASPYRSAVAKLWAKRKGESPNKLALVRQQVQAAADQIWISTLEDEFQPANAGPEHFFIEVPLNGRPAAEVEALAPTLKSLLMLPQRDWSMAMSDASEPGSLRFVCHAVEPADRLVAQKNGASWFDANQAQSPMLLPLAVNDEGEPVCLAVHHTFIYGTTGAGKGSVLSGIMRQLAPFIAAGLVEVYAIDPNGAELEKFARSGLLKAYATLQDDAEELVKYVYNLMNVRSQSLVRSEENEYGDKHVISKETPLVLLVIDEASSYLDSAQSTRQGKEPMNALSMIYAQGRKRGFFVIAAAQNARAETLPRNIAANIQNWVLLRVGVMDGYFNNLLLGEEAVRLGFDATKITPGPAAEGLPEDKADKLTAGIGFIRRGSNMPVKVRFAHMDGPSLRRLADKYALPEGQSVPKLPTMSGQLQASFENLSVELSTVSADAPAASAPVAAPPVKKPAVENRLKSYFDEEEAIVAPKAAPRSQVDELAVIRRWDDVTLDKRISILENDPAKMKQLAWRARLDAMKAEQRTRKMMAHYRPAPSDDEALPDLDF